MFEWLRRRLAAPSLPDLSTACVVDVRSTAEYQRGHIDGAISLPLDQIPTQASLRLPQHEATIVVYCQSGMRSAQARKQLQRLGYLNVHNGGGMSRLTKHTPSHSVSSK